MKTLLFIAPHIGYGGAEKNFIGIANYVANHGFNVFLLTEEGAKNVRPIDEKIKQLTASLDHNAGMLKKYYQAIKVIKKSIKISHADMVVSFVELWRSASILATRFSRVKCIVSERVDPYSRSGRFNKIIFAIFSLADGFVFQTEQAQRFFPTRVQKKSVIIPNPVFPEDCLQEYTGVKKNVIVNIARLDVKQKRQDIIIQAFYIISKKYPDYHLLLYGDGADKDIIEKKIAELGLTEKVELKGVTSNVYQSLGEAQVMILASDYEGIPNAIIESMCVGVPVVSTKCSPGGAEFLINHGENGLLVERGDYQGIADCVDKLLSSSELRNSIKKQGLMIKERLSYDKVLSKWIEYFNMIC